MVKRRARPWWNRTKVEVSQKVQAAVDQQQTATDNVKLAAQLIADGSRAVTRVVELDARERERKENQ